MCPYQLWLTCPLSLTLYQREALCQIPSSFTLYPWVFIMPMSPEGAGGWLVVCSRAAVEYAAFCRGVSQWVCVCVSERGRGVGCGTAYSASFHMGRLQSRKGGWQAAILSLRQDFIADGMLRMSCLIWMPRGRILPDGSDTHRIILRLFLLWSLYSPRLSKSHCAFLL